MKSEYSIHHSCHSIKDLSVSLFFSEKEIIVKHYNGQCIHFCNDSRDTQAAANCCLVGVFLLIVVKFPGIILK